MQALMPALGISLVLSFLELVLLFVSEPDKINTPRKVFVTERVAN